MRLFLLLAVLWAAPARALQEPRAAKDIKFSAADPKTGCTPEQRAAVERALLGGSGFAGARERAALARDRLAKASPFCPAAGAPPAGEGGLACRVSRELFGDKIQKIDLLGRVMAIDLALQGGPDIRCAPKRDKNCGNRKGFVKGSTLDGVFTPEPVIWLCPRFFSADTDDASRAQSIVHEAAHLAGVASQGNEAYCLAFDCETACGDVAHAPRMADTWAHLVDCLAGQSPGDDSDFRVTP